MSGFSTTECTENTEKDLPCEVVGRLTSYSRESDSLCELCVLCGSSERFVVKKTKKG
jgi:hypothetical protein